MPSAVTELAQPQGTPEDHHVGGQALRGVVVAVPIGLLLETEQPEQGIRVGWITLSTISETTLRSRSRSGLRLFPRPAPPRRAIP